MSYVLPFHQQVTLNSDFLDEVNICVVIWYVIKIISRTSYHTITDWLQYHINLATISAVNFRQKKISCSQ